MSSAQNETLLRRSMDFMSRPDTTLSDAREIIDSNWTVTSPFPPTAKGPEGALQVHDMFHKAFSDFRVVIDRIVDEGEWVTCYYTMEGRQTGEFMGIAPTGKSFKMNALGTFRFQNGKQVEGIVMPDRLGLLQQLGVLQVPGGAQRRAA